jgi:formylglycine-generating enzyme required for sulfatase activity
MKPLLYLFIGMLSLSGSSISQSNSTVDDRWIKKQFVRVEEGLMMARHETTNADYRRFLDALLEEGKTEEYLRCLPDTQSWLKLGVQATPLVSHYFRNPSFDHYPVTGLKRASVDAYLQWLTKVYRSQEKIRHSGAVFSLASRDEWIHAAQAGDTSKVYPWGSGFIRNNRGEDLCNYRHVELQFDSTTRQYVEIPEKQPDIFRGTTRVDTYFPNAFGLFNMSGNVAEMINEPGTAMGGSFNDPAWKVRIKSEQGFGRPTPMVGFRAAIRIPSGG